MCTGAKHWQDLFMANMQSQPFYLKAVGPDGKRVDQSLLGIFEPVQMFRYVIPKEGLGIALKTLNVDQENLLKQRFSPQLWAMRKALGLKEIPKIDLPTFRMPVATENLQIIPIGIKEDETRVMTGTGVTQEDI